MSFSNLRKGSSERLSFFLEYFAEVLVFSKTDVTDELDKEFDGFQILTTKHQNSQFNTLQAVSNKLIFIRMSRKS